MRISRESVRARTSTSKTGGLALVAAAALAACPALAAPYASNVQISGTSVNFILNESADALQVIINGGAPIALDGSSAGLKNFTLTAPTDTFSIVAKKSDTGYLVPTGASTAGAVANGLSVATPFNATKQVGADVKYNSPRGVSVSTNPNAPNFGTTYVANSDVGTSGGRALGDGLYAVRADRSDAFGYGDTAQTGSLTFTGSTSSPYRVHAAADGNVYIADFSDANGQVARLSTNLSSSDRVLAGVGGPFPVPAGQNHGSTTAVHAVTGPGGLTLYTLDEDLTTNAVTGAGSTADRNSVWKYSIGTSTLPYAAMPTKVNVNNVLVATATSDMEVGADGKFYLMQNRSAGGESGVVVLNADGTTAFSSLQASRDLLGNPTAADIFRNVQGIAVSPDQAFLAVVLNNSDVAVMPLVNGVPNIANRFLIDTGADTASGRDIAFDAANNIHYVSSGQAVYRVLSPGGDMTSTLTWDGSSFAFAAAVPEPTALGALGLGAVALAGRRRRRA